jgi:hypothetical protein
MPLPTTWQVVHSARVPMRDAPDTSAKVIGSRRPGQDIMVNRVENGWAKVEGEGWILVDGTSEGVGLLLAPVDEDTGKPILPAKPPPAAAAATPADDPEESARDRRLDFPPGNTGRAS